MEEPIMDSFLGISKIVLKKLWEYYWRPLYKYLSAHPNLVRTVPGFLISPEKIILYFGKTHLGIEYTGVERIDHLPKDVEVQAQYFDFTQIDDNFLEKIIGFKYDDGTSSVQIPLAPFLEELIMPTNKGADKLAELNWLFAAQDSITVFNSSCPYLIKDEYYRIVNGLFFDADERGLFTRHIKWIDFVPIQYDDTNPERDSYTFNLAFYTDIVESDCQYVYPLPDNYDYQHSRLQRVNRLIELAGNNTTTEPEITQFLAKSANQFILAMRFGAVAIHSEVVCEWQSENRAPIRPDFFVVQPNGFADIVEFKLPVIDTLTVGRINREAFSSQINSYIAQTRTYREYFEDPNNRKWFEDKYGYKVYQPRRHLVIGRRWHFDNEIWKEIISDYRDLELTTYDDLVDGVVAQLYM